MMNSPETSVAAQFARAQLLQQQGQLEAARTAYQAILDAEPGHFDALNAMGVLAGQSKDLQQAIQYFERAIEVQPGNSGAHCNRGLALKQLGQREAALQCFDRAVALDSGSVIAYYSRAEAYKDLGRPDEALASYDQAIAVNSGFLHAFYRRGLVLQQIARPEEAIASYDRVLQIKPDHFDAHLNRAMALFSVGRHAEALPTCDQAIALKPDQAFLHLLRGDVLRALDRREEALASYDKAIAINPNDAQAHCNRGMTLLLQHKTDAIPSFDKAIQINPDCADAYYHRGYSLRLLNRFDSAAADYKKVAALAPDFDYLPGSRLEASLQICDWSDYEALVGQIAAGLENDGYVAHPFIFMALSDSARLQRKAARAWVKYACSANGALGPIAPRGRPEKLKIGYFSSDFHEHPVGRLLVELIEIHDRSQVEVIGFSFGGRTNDALQQRLMRAFDRFIDVRDKSSLEIAALSRSLNIDIAVDLGGHTFGNRASIFALRAAPVQVNYLGYLGTTGADYIDYIVADPVVVTPETESHYSERVIYLPDTHQVNDRNRVIADEVFTREELDLPQTGFVFCCFNSGYKISPATFAGWMRMLKAVPESVLLLYAAYEPIEANLRAQAAKQDVDPRRLVFGERLAPPEYLARYRAADLFLDTFPYTAGTTASDALWVGLPVLTLTGEAFVSRTAASLLTAIGAPELITSTRQEYEQLAIELALNPQRLAEIRAKIERNRLSCSLFDTQRFARNLESAYRAIHDRYHSGLPPDHIRF
jgi:predicted O-linked N-acetylglucosamine transferase (SPINDLY family)